MPLTVNQSAYWWPVFAGLVVTGVGQGLAFPALTVLGLRGVPQAQQGAASAVTATATVPQGGITP
ncbi:MFS transporter [Streptomyces alboniger]|uniref:MFS transporter n=1 Tax=Streptomyces alboniger TaxID=132473 RepID=UPI000A733701|nr:MFS transporter [Streptomyces alboniger]